jgi:hypothetical protein
MDAKSLTATAPSPPTCLAQPMPLLRIAWDYRKECYLMRIMRVL